MAACLDLDAMATFAEKLRSYLHDKGIPQKALAAGLSGHGAAGRRRERPGDDPEGVFEVDHANDEPIKPVKTSQRPDMISPIQPNDDAAAVAEPDDLRARGDGGRRRDPRR